MPDGEQVTAYDDEFVGVVSITGHNPHIAIEERDFFLQVQECQELLQREAKGIALKPEELELIQVTREMLGEVEPPPPEPKKKYKARPSKPRKAYSALLKLLIKTSLIEASNTNLLIDKPCTKQHLQQRNQTLTGLICQSLLGSRIRLDQEQQLRRSRAASMSFPFQNQPESVSTLLAVSPVSPAPSQRLP